MLYTVIAFGIYCAILVGISIYAYKQVNDSKSYILGSRSLGAWVTSMSAQASDMSGWLILGIPGAAMATGISSAWIAIGLIIGSYLNWTLLATRIRIYSEIASDTVTLPSFITARYKSKSKILNIVAAFFIVIFFSLYVASGFVAGAKLFSSIFDMSYLYALGLGAVIIIAYTYVGGYLAVSMTDFIQGVVMFIALIILPTSAFLYFGSFDEITTSIKSANPNMLSMWNNIDGSAISTIGIISLVSWGLGYFGQPHILARFMGIKDYHELRKAKIIGMSWMVISMIGALLVGLLGFAYFQMNGIDPTTVMKSEEEIFFVLGQIFFHPFMVGFLFSAAMAAIMSTADSQLLVVSSAISEDFFGSISKNITEKQKLKVGRNAILIVSIIAIFIARDENSGVLSLVSQAWAGFGATFGPVLLLSLFWKRSSYVGACAAMIAGGVTIGVWLLCRSHSDAVIFEIYEMLPGFLVALLMGVVFSLLFPCKDDTVGKEYDKMCKMLKS